MLFQIKTLLLLVFTFLLHSQVFTQNLQEKQGRSTDQLCQPYYSQGCNGGDGLDKFFVGAIENYNSGCEDNTGYQGWSQYLDLGPALLVPGSSHEVKVQSNYNNQYVSIWIDFNNDFELTEDERIATDLHLQNSDELYSYQLEIPATSIPGLHFMRVRVRWANPCLDACEEYSWGEAEDYMVTVGQAIYGTLQGTVSTLSSGASIGGATIISTIGYPYAVISASDGTFEIADMLEGEYTMECSKQGYNTAVETFTIEEDQITTVNFQLTQPAFSVDPLTISKTLAPNTTGEEILTVQNTGDGEVNWSASLTINRKNTDDFLDLQFQYPLEQYDEQGIATDGTYFYTTEPGGNEFYKYDLDGTFIEEFTLPDTEHIREITYDGTYFYGGNGSSDVYVMDFEAQDLIDIFSAPEPYTAIAYNHIDDVFYTNDLNSPILTFDRSGTLLNSFNVGPEGENYTGLAFDNNTPGGPFLWAYAQTGISDNELIQIQLPTGNETGFTLDVGGLLSGSIWSEAAGLFIYPDLISDKLTIGGVVGGQWLWGLELGDVIGWINGSPLYGTLEAGTSEDILFTFDANNLQANEYTAEIIFSTLPDVGEQMVNVILTVSDQIPDPPSNIQTIAGDCETADICWDVSAADSCSIFNNGIWMAGTTEQCYTVAGPGNYEIYLTAWLDGVESEPSASITFQIEWPEDLEPANLTVENVINNLVYLSWDIPVGCVNSDGFNIYRNGEQINSSLLTDNSYSDIVEVSDTYEYAVTAVYYFGESDFSNTVSVMVVSIEEISDEEISIFPNPFSDEITLEVYLQNPENLEIGIYNQLGLAQMTWVKKLQNAGNHQIHLDVAELPAGVYYCIIKTSSGKKTQKIIKLK